MLQDSLNGLLTHETCIINDKYFRGILSRTCLAATFEVAHKVYYDSNTNLLVKHGFRSEFYRHDLKYPFVEDSIKSLIRRSTVSAYGMRAERGDIDVQPPVT